MGKKANTVLFILAATVFNLIAFAVCFALLLLVFTLLNSLFSINSETVTLLMLAIAFFGAIILSFLLYRMILKKLEKKINMEKYFTSLFGSQRKGLN